MSKMSRNGCLAIFRRMISFSSNIDTTWGVDKNRPDHRKVFVDGACVNSD